MNRISIVAALLCTAPLAPFTPLASAQPALTPAACQPLSSANLEACCAAENWREIILPEHVAFCPPLDAADTDSGRLGQTIADTGPGNGIDEEPTGSIPGNPGNQEQVGGAGEKGMDTEPEGTSTAPTGDKGTSN